MAGPSGARGQPEELSQADASSRPIATPRRLVRRKSFSTRHGDGTASPGLAQLARRSRELQADFHSISAEEPPSSPQQSRSRSRGRGQDPSESLVAIATPQRKKIRLTPRKPVAVATPRSVGAPAPGSVRDAARRAPEAPRLQGSRSQRAPATPGTPLTPSMHRLISSERTAHSSAPMPSPSVSSAYRSAKRARPMPRDVDAQALQEENERLRRENLKLRVVQADREEMKAAFEEIDKLRRQNVELAKGSASAAGDLGEQRSTDSGTLEPRGHGTQFNIHLWEVERRSQKGAAESDDGVMAIMPTEAVVSQSQTQSSGKEVPAEPAVPVAVGARLDPAVQPWIFHASLASAREQNLGSQFTIPPRLQSLQADVACGLQDELASKLTDVFREHLEDPDRPYLAFSALIPSLFGMLCVANQLASGSSGCRYAQCAALIRHLMNTSRFGEKPPKKKPENMTRDSFVRELCAQAGLSLDLARLGMAHRNELRSARSASQLVVESATPARAVVQLRLQDTPAEAMSIQKESSLASLESGAHTPQDADDNVSQVSQSNASNAGSTSAASSQTCVDKVELKGVLARAGRYLAAVQMDMERLHDEHNSRRRAAVAAMSKVEPAAETQESAQPEARPEPLPGLEEATAANLAITDGTEPLEAEAPADLLAHDLDDEASMPSLPLDFPSVSAEQVRSLLAAASSEPQLEESAVAGTAPSAASQSTTSMLADAAILDDPLVMPPLGKFLTDQLLPLYVGDIPFETLKNLIDRYCGIPIDSDDEERAWKVWGRPCPKRKPRPDTRKRQTSRESSTGDKPSVPSTASGTPAAEGAESQETFDPSLSPHQDLSHLPEAVRSLRRRASAETVPFSQLRQVIEKPPTMGPPTMRNQMLTSTIEKRRTDHAAPADWTGSSRASRLRSHSSNTLTSRDPTPAIKPSQALLRTPGTDALGTPASLRKAAWRQLNEAADTSTRKPRSEGGLRVRGSPAPAAPNWGLLDTPARPRPMGEEA